MPDARSRTRRDATNKVEGNVCIHANTLTPYTIVWLPAGVHLLLQVRVEQKQQQGHSLCALFGCTGCLLPG